MNDEKKCACCGEQTDDDYARFDLYRMDPSIEGPLCEGCCDETIEAILSSDADARELGLDELDAYDARSDFFDC